MKMYPANFLIHTALVNRGIRIALVIVAVTFLSYGWVLSDLKSQALEQLEKYTFERGQRESALFQLAEDNHAILKHEFLARYHEMADEDPREAFGHVLSCFMALSAIGTGIPGFIGRKM